MARETLPVFAIIRLLRGGTAWANMFWPILQNVATLKPTGTFRVRNVSLFFFSYYVKAYLECGWRCSQGRFYDFICLWISKKVKHRGTLLSGLGRIRKCISFWFSSPKMFKKWHTSHWPYRGGNSTFLGDFILINIKYKYNWVI